MNLEMVPIEIIGLKKDLQAVLRALRKLGCMHIEDLSEMTETSARPLTLDRDTLHQQEELSFLAARIGGLLDALGGSRKNGAGDLPENYLEQARKGVQELLPKVKEITEQREALEAELASLPRYEATLKKLMPIIPASVREPGNRSVGVLVDRENIQVLDMVGKRVFDLTLGQAEVVASDVDVSTRAMLIVFPEKYANQIESLLGKQDISRLRLPSELGDGSPDVLLEALQRRVAAIPAQVKELENQRAALSAEWSEKLAAWRAALQDEIDASRILSKFGETDLTFVLAGWIPAQALAQVESTLRASASGAASVRPLKLTPQLLKRAPVILQNPRFIKPFESLVKLLALPRYGHLDPTRLMALFMPIFFGMILGDVAYGILALAISLYSLRRIKEQGIVRDILIILAMGSGWSIVFGFLFGEFFGTLGEYIGIYPLWFDRTSPDYVSALLVMTIALGAVHITFGLVLGLFEAVKDRSRHHLLERGGMLLGLMGLFFIVGVLTNYLPDGFMNIAIAGMLVGVVLLSASLGKLGIVMGPIEFITLIGNVLSYLRIAAIGLASVYLAKVANEMAGLAGNIIVGAVLAILIHALNLVLGMFSPTIHSLRLHYVEFFRKFYEGGGRAYEPFRNRV